MYLESWLVLQTSATCLQTTSFGILKKKKKLPYPYSRAPGSQSKAPGAPDCLQEANGLPSEKADGGGAL